MHCRCTRFTRFLPLIVGSLAFGVSLGQGAPAAAPLVVQPVPANVGVVKTADDLAAQPILQTDQGPTHIGIDTAAPLAYGNVTLYCLFDAPPPPPSRGPPPPGAHFNQGLAAALHPASLQYGSFSGMGAAIPRPKAAAKFLAHSLFTGPPGDYLLEVRLDNTIIARAAIKVAPREAEGWLPLTGQLPSAADPAPRFAPYFRPAAPIFALAEPDVPAGDLPTADVPTTASDGFHIEADGNILTIAHWPAPAFIPERQLLAAFYVNGQRYVPEMPANSTGDGGHFGLMGRDAPFTLTLAVDRAAIKAKAGDKVEVELLCAPAGRADFVNGDRPRFPVSGPILRSNRITLPGGDAPAPPSPEP